VCLIVINPATMFKTVFSAFFRNLRKGDLHSIINLAGLGVGLATCLLIFLYLADELRYDQHHEHAPYVYRLLQYNQNSGVESAVKPGVLYDHIHGQIPGVEKLARYYHLRESVMAYDGQPFTEYGFAAADPEFLDILSLEFLAGDPGSALSDPHSLVLTESAVEKYFGQEDPMGKTMVFANAVNYVVTGVIADPSRHSHISFSMLGALESMGTYNRSLLTNWQNSGTYYYMRLGPDADPNLVEDRINRIVWDMHENYEDVIFYVLQPMLDIRLYSSDVEWDMASKGDIYVVIIFSAAALLILFLAGFNFVNLSTAAAIRRSLEVGVRKVLGANRGQLIRQFLLETFVYAFFAMCIALLLVELLLPALNSLSGKEMSQPFLSVPLFPVVVIGLVIIVPLIAGMYPALIMSRFQAITAIKGGSPLSSLKGLRNKRYQLRMRQLLLLFQFAVSIALIVASLMIYQQMRFLSLRNPGYQSEGLIAVKNPWDAQSASRAVWLREQLLQNPDVVNVSLSHNIPTNTPNNYAAFSFERDDGAQRFHGALISCDPEFFQTLGTKVLQGRAFLADMPTDVHSSAMINRTAAEQMGVDDPTGVTLQGFYDGNSRQVVGVVEDIHYTSMHDAVNPMVFYINHENYPQNWFNILVRSRPGKASDVLAQIDELWSSTAPQWPLQHFFLEEQTRALYQDDKRVMNIVGTFAGLAIFLSVLGLVGLAIFAANTRIREIGIRKVLGASVFEVVRMISNEFGTMALIANVIALPVAWYFINRWLENFAYRADTNWLVFIVPAVMVYLVAWAVVGGISWRAALLNPTDSVRARG
jgi:putative ABC transport system permease protein